MKNKLNDLALDLMFELEEGDAQIIEQEIKDITDKMSGIKDYDVLPLNYGLEEDNIKLRDGQEIINIKKEDAFLTSKFLHNGDVRVSKVVE